MKKLILFFLSVAALLAILKIWLPIGWEYVTLPIWLPATIGCCAMAASIRSCDKHYPTSHDTTDWGEKMEVARRNQRK